MQNCFDLPEIRLHFAWGRIEDCQCTQIVRPKREDRMSPIGDVTRLEIRLHFA